MTPLELRRLRWDVPVGRREGLVRAGTRAAGVGLTAVSAARRLKALGAMGERDAARERILVLRDAARRALQLHGVELEAGGAMPFGAALLASNHVSWLDPLVVASILPCVPVSKLDVGAWPVVGALARDLGVVFVSRGDPRSGVRALRAAEAALRRGLPVLNFPEGTTTDGLAVLPFRKGLFGVALAAGVAVVPVAIAYDPPELAWVGADRFVPHWLKLASKRRARARVRFGAPLSPADHSCAADLAAAAHRDVSTLLRELNELR